MTKRREWHEKLLPQEEVRRWYENLARKSPATADVYLRSVARGLDAQGLSPVDLLRMEQQDLENTVSDCVNDLLDRGLQGSTVGHFEKSVKSFLRWNGRNITRSNNIPGRSDHPTAEDEQIPSQEDLAAALAACSPRAAASLAMIAFAGVRPQVLGNYDGSNGLRLRDLPDLDLATLTFKEVPARVNVSRALSKIKKPFFTFIGREACNFIQVYLQQRRHGGRREGETLTEDSPLIIPDTGPPRFCMRNNICDTIRRAMRSVNLSQRVYIWRSYYANRCMMAEPKGYLASWRKFFMGHTGDIQTRYGLRKQLQDDVVDQMRGGYEKALPFLETARVAVDDPVPEFLESILRVDGASDEDIRRLGLQARSRDEQVQAARDLLASLPGVEAEVAPSPREPKQRLVGLEEVEGLLASGWVFKAALPDGRIIVEKF